MVENGRFVGSEPGEEFLKNSEPDLRANFAHVAIPRCSSQLNDFDDFFKVDSGKETSRGN